MNEYDAVILHNDLPQVSGVYTDGGRLTAIYRIRMIANDEQTAVQLSNMIARGDAQAAQDLAAEEMQRDQSDHPHWTLHLRAV